MFEQIPRTKKETKTFYDHDLKKMSEQGFKPPGWMKYDDSPYREYQRRLKALHEAKTEKG